MVTKSVAVIIGATSKWQADGRNTHLVHGGDLDDSQIPLTARCGVGGAIAQRFAKEDYSVVLTTRTLANAAPLQQAILDQGQPCMTVELDLSSAQSIASAFSLIRDQLGEPEVVVLNAGYLEGRDLPREKELLEHMPLEFFETAQHVASRGPFLVAKEILPAMRERGSGSFLITNNAAGLRGRKRYTGQSLYYPRVMMRALAQALTEEYSEYGVHIANIVVDGLIDSPGTRSLPMAIKNPDMIMDPEAIAGAFFYLHSQHRSCWSHELQLTPFTTKPSVG